MPCTLDLGPTHKCLHPHTDSPQAQGACGISMVTLKYTNEECSLPGQLQGLREELWGKQPTHVPTPPCTCPHQNHLAGLQWACVGESMAECWVCLGRVLCWVSESSRT